MTQARDEQAFGNWCKFLVGTFAATTGLEKLHRYYVTGNVVHESSKLFLLPLVGADAALFYALYLVAGVVLLVAGIRGLRSK